MTDKAPGRLLYACKMGNQNKAKIHSHVCRIHGFQRLGGLDDEVRHQVV